MFLDMLSRRLNKVNPHCTLVSVCMIREDDVAGEIAALSLETNKGEKTVVEEEEIVIPKKKEKVGEKFCAMTQKYTHILQIKI